MRTKRVISILIIIICFSLNSCSTKPGDNNMQQSSSGKLGDSNQTSTTNLKNEFVMNKEKIFKLIGMSKSELIKVVGNEYEEIASGPEGSEVGLYYMTYGLTIDLDENEIARVITVTDNIKINGVSSDMNFRKAEIILKEQGFVPVYDKIKIVEAGEVKYFLEYVDNGYRIVLASFDKEGVDSVMTISK